MQLQLAVHLTPVTVKRVLQISKRSQKLGLWLLKHRMNPIPTRIKKKPPPAAETLETLMLKRLKIPKKHLKRSLVRLQYWYNKFRVTYKDKLKNVWRRIGLHQFMDFSKRVLQLWKLTVIFSMSSIVLHRHAKERAIGSKL